MYCLKNKVMQLQNYFVKWLFYVHAFGGSYKTNTVVHWDMSDPACLWCDFSFDEWQFGWYNSETFLKKKKKKSLLRLLVEVHWVNFTSSISNNHIASSTLMLIHNRILHKQKTICIYVAELRLSLQKYNKLLTDIYYLSSEEKQLILLPHWEAERGAEFPKQYIPICLM